MDTQHPLTTDRRHLIAVDDLDQVGIQRILDTAEGFESIMRRDVKKVPTLRGRTVMTVFFSPRRAPAPRSSWPPSGCRRTP